jgi:hypothetical protein
MVEFFKSIIPSGCIRMKYMEWIYTKSTTNANSLLDEIQFDNMDESSGMRVAWHGMTPKR